MPTPRPALARAPQNAGIALLRHREHELIQRLSTLMIADTCHGRRSSELRAWSESRECSPSVHKEGAGWLSFVIINRRGTAGSCARRQRRKQGRRPRDFAAVTSTAGLMIGKQERSRLRARRRSPPELRYAGFPPLVAMVKATHFRDSTSQPTPGICGGHPSATTPFAHYLEDGRHLATRRIFLRREARTRGHAFVVLAVGDGRGVISLSSGVSFSSPKWQRSLW